MMVLFAAFAHGASANLAEDLSQMKEGKTEAFDSKGHPKSRGLALQIQYPRSWERTEGVQPLVLQTFVAKDGLASLMFGSSPLPPETAHRSGTPLTAAETRTMMPQGCQSVKLSTATLDGLPASTVEYTMEETPKLLLQRGLIFYILAEGQLVVIHGMAVKPAGQSLKAFDAEWETAKEIFRRMAGSVDFP